MSDNTGYKWLQFAEEFVALESPSAWHSKEVELEPDPADEKVDHNSGHGKCHPADEKAKNTKKNHLAKLRGVLDPNRVPTIPFSTRLGPVPVRVPT